MDDPKNTAKRKKVAGLALSLVLAALLGSVLFFAAPGREGSTPEGLKDYYRQKGVEETGSINLVSSIYLGYRAMDTLGETVVLLLTVTGVIAIMGERR